jgi:uncharacterized membrane protein
LITTWVRNVGGVAMIGGRVWFDMFGAKAKGKTALGQAG